MITDKLTVFGDREDVANICDLTAKCAETLGLAPCETVLCASENVPVSQASDAALVVLPYEIKEKAKGKRVFTYSESESGADAVLLNLQNRESTTCFEVLSGTDMSRVFVPLSSDCTCTQVLACVSVLCAWGAPVSDAVSAVNSILK